LANHDEAIANRFVGVTAWSKQRIENLVQRRFGKLATDGFFFEFVADDDVHAPDAANGEHRFNEVGITKRKIAGLKKLGLHLHIEGLACGDFCLSKQRSR
jgi:hypothetical protein